MERLKELIRKFGLVVVDNNGKLKGNSCNIVAYPVFNLWINKSGNLTVKTRGVQKSFKDWESEDDFGDILRGLEII